MRWRYWVLLAGIAFQLCMLELSVVGRYSVVVQALLAALVVHASWLFSRLWRERHPREEDPDEH